MSNQDELCRALRALIVSDPSLDTEQGVADVVTWIKKNTRGVVETLPAEPGKAETLVVKGDDPREDVIVEITVKEGDPDYAYIGAEWALKESTLAEGPRAELAEAVAG